MYPGGREILQGTFRREKFSRASHFDTPTEVSEYSFHLSHFHGSHTRAISFVPLSRLAHTHVISFEPLSRLAHTRAISFEPLSRLARHSFHSGTFSSYVDLYEISFISYSSS